MKHILEVLKDKNFKVVKGSEKFDYSTMLIDGLRTLFEDKNGNKVIYGLNEYKKPLTNC